jgi:hypothetical protein
VRLARQSYATQLSLPLAFDATSQRHPLERERSLSPKWCAVASRPTWKMEGMGSACSVST